MMTKSESADRLGVSIDAATAEIEQKFRELYRDVKTRLDDAPTASLKRKYQSELQGLQEAFDTLCPSGRDSDDYPTDTPVYDENGPAVTAPDTAVPPPIHAATSRRWTYIVTAVVLCVLAAITYGAVAHFQEEQSQERARAETARQQKAAADAKAADKEASEEQAAAKLKRQQDAELARQRAEALRMKQEAEDTAAAAARQKQQAEAAAAAARAQQQAAQAAAQQAERDKADALAQQKAAEEAARRKKDDEDSKPKTARVTLSYSGDYYGCGLSLNVRIGDKSFQPGSNPYRVSGVPIGDQDYRVSGRITCAGGAWCTASGSGSLDVSDGDKIEISWANDGFGHCSVRLD